MCFGRSNWPIVGRTASVLASSFYCLSFYLHIYKWPTYTKCSGSGSPCGWLFQSKTPFFPFSQQPSQPILVAKCWRLSKTAAMKCVFLFLAFWLSASGGKTWTKRVFDLFNPKEWYRKDCPTLNYDGKKRNLQWFIERRFPTPLLLWKIKYKLVETYPCHIAVQAHQIEEFVRVGSIVVQSIDHHDGALKKTKVETQLKCCCVTKKGNNILIIPWQKNINYNSIRSPTWYSPEPVLVGWRPRGHCVRQPLRRVPSWGQSDG